MSAGSVSAGQAFVMVGLDPKPLDKGLGKLQSKLSNAFSKLGRKSAKEFQNGFSSLPLNPKALGAGIKPSDIVPPEVKQNVDTLSTSMNKLGSNITSVGVQFAKLGALMAVPLTLAVRAGAAFEAQMKRVQAVANATAAEFQALTDAARQLGRTTTFTATEAGQAMEFLARAGFSVNEILKTIPHTLDLAKAGAVDLGQAADITANTLRTFGLEAKDSDRVVDVLAQTARKSNTTITALGQSFKFSGASANLLGQSIEETSANLAILANRGLRGTLAGTAFNQVLTKLADSSTIAALKLRGIDVEDAVTGEFRKAGDIIQDFGDSLKGLSVAEFNAAFSIFGLRGARAAKVIATVGGELDDMRGKINDNANAARDSRKVIESSLLATYEKLISAITDVAITITDVLKPSLLSMVKFFTDATNSINLFIRQNEYLVTGFALVAVGVVALGAAFTAFGVILTSLAAAMVAIPAILGVMAVAGAPFLAVVAGIGLAITGLIAGGIALGKVYDHVFTDMSAKIKETEKETRKLNASIANMNKEIARLDVQKGLGSNFTSEAAEQQTKEEIERLIKVGKTSKEIDDEMLGNKKKLYNRMKGLAARNTTFLSDIEKKNLAGLKKETLLTYRAISKAIEEKTAAQLIAAQTPDIGTKTNEELTAEKKAGEKIVKLQESFAQKEEDIARARAETNFREAFQKQLTDDPSKALQDAKVELDKYEAQVDGVRDQIKELEESTFEGANKGVAADPVDAARLTELQGIYEKEQTLLTSRIQNVKAATNAVIAEQEKERATLERNVQSLQDRLQRAANNKTGFSKLTEDAQSGLSDIAAKLKQALTGELDIDFRSTKLEIDRLLKDRKVKVKTPKISEESVVTTGGDNVAEQLGALGAILDQSIEESQLDEQITTNSILTEMNERLNPGYQ